MKEGPQIRTSAWTRNKFFYLLICLGLLPFILRVGLDTHQTVKQPLLEIYRDWRWGPEARQWRSGDALIFERISDRSAFETMFMNQLQKDFRVQQAGENLPRVRAYFDSTGRSLLGRIETQLPEGERQWKVFSAKGRFPNNGILFGLWVGLLVFVLGAGLQTCIMMSVFATLFWAAEWNLLALPELLYSYGLSVVRELSYRIQYADWTSGDLGRVPDLALLIWLPIGLAINLINRFKKNANLKLPFYFAVAAVLFEPIVLWTSSIFGKWPAETVWWKIYLGSWGYRFFTLSFLFFILIKPKSVKKVFRGELFQKEGILFSPWWVLLPLTFVMTGGWDWLGTVFFDGMPEPILKMKSFFVGALVGALCGSRFFAIWIVTFSLAVLHPPSRGHWSAAASYGLLWEGVALGWWMSPLKNFSPREILNLKPQNIKYLLMALCWIMGVFLCSVGVPLGLCWLILILAIWAVMALRSGQTIPSSEDALRVT